MTKIASDFKMTKVISYIEIAIKIYDQSNKNI